MVLASVRWRFQSSLRRETAEVRRCAFAVHFSQFLTLVFSAGVAATREVQAIKIVDIPTLRAAAVVVGGVFAGVASATGSEPNHSANGTLPKVYLAAPAELAAMRQRVRAGDKALVPALTKLRSQADKALLQKPVSVMDKAQTPATGNKHDYMSVGPYWWPDPDKPDGLPYIRRDGEVHSSRGTLDDGPFKTMLSAVVALGRAYAFTGHEPYAAHAATLLRTWFLDPATRMNPNLTCAQAIPGRCTGRGIGIVDWGGVPVMIDAVGMLDGSTAWTAADRLALQKWFGELLTWLTDSDYGKDEQRTSNNHATQYDAQVACYALFTGREDLARLVISEVGRRRIDTQILPDGSQPQELARTKSWDYSCGNTRNFCHLALLGERVGVDLWAYAGSQGQSIRMAVDYLLPFATGEKVWNRKQILPFHAAALALPLRLATRHFGDVRHLAALNKLAGEDGATASADDLLYPLAPPP